MLVDRFVESKPIKLIDPATALAAAVTGNSIDTKDYRSLTAPLDIVISAGSLDSVKFQESPDDSVWADVPDAETLYYPGSFPVIADALIHIGSVAKERYVRVVLTCTAPTGTVGAVGFLQDSIIKPMVKESSVIADADMILPGNDPTPPLR
jgi:hypothetical protein